MTYVIEQFENRLKSFLHGSSDVTVRNLIFEKKNSCNPFGEFSVFLSNKKLKKDEKNDTFIDATNILPEFQGIKIHSKKENWTLIIDNIEIECNRIILKINREHAIQAGLELVTRLGSEYGVNNNFKDKVFILKQEIDGNKIDLTSLRTELTSQLIKNLINAGGGLLYKTDARFEGLLLKVGKKCYGGNAVTIGVVKTTNNDISLYAEDYRKLRIKDITELNENKGYCLEDVQNLANAAISFDMLSTKVDRPVTLNVSNEPMTVREHSTKGATFVIYNYARICAIVDQFHNKVANKIYNHLPPISEISSELLTQKEEWSLMFDYILEWPEIVSSAQNLSVLKLHNICNFLSSLSLCFSTYYRHYRVLTDPLPQLLPVMNARIHLILGLKQIYENGFKLLSIGAPTHM